MNLKSLMAAIALVPSIVPLVRDTVQEVETLFAALPGAQKLAAATARVESLIDAAITDLGVVTKLKTIVEPLINAAVAMFNEAKVGAFAPASAAGTTTTNAEADPAAADAVRT